MHQHHYILQRGNDYHQHSQPVHNNRVQTLLILKHDWPDRNQF